MFTFHPHVHARDIVTTPDILIDRASRFGLARSESYGTEDLSSTTVLKVSDSELFPALVIVAAHGAPLLSAGFDGGRGRAIIGRQSWRMSDVVGQMHRLVLRVRTKTRAGEKIEEHALPQLPAADLPRASAVFCSNNGLRLNVTGLNWCETEIFDPVLDRALRHRVWLGDLQ